MRRFWVLVAAFVSALAFVLGYDIATMIPPPTERFDPRQIRVISEAETTSTCIGDTSTPICSVETLKACYFFRRLDYCEKVNVHEPYFGGQPSPRAIVSKATESSDHAT